MRSYEAWLVGSPLWMSVRMLRPGFLSAAAVALIGLGSSSPAAAQQTCTVVFNEVGEHSFTVPNVDEIAVDAFGASGGDTIPPVNPPGFPGLGAAALGAVLPVSPGEVLTVRVGGRGEDTIAQAGTGPGAAGGFNGGGDGGDKTSGSGTAHTGAGGGGASDVLRGTDRLLIAGGGGGGAHSGLGGDGGEDGTDGTSDGDNPDSFGRSGGNGGAGGPGSGPGSDGETSDPTSGVGGKGGGGVDAGSGGGGGLRGGGGGGGGALGNGAGGGGGSSFGPAGTTFETGANEGDGRVEIRYQCQSGISIVKTGSGPDPLEVGATVDYTFEVTNTGNVPLTDVTVTDPLDGLSPIDCPGDTLDPGESMTCTATYVVTQADVEAGVIENTATATGQPPPDTDLPPPDDDDTTTVPPTQNLDIEIIKSGSGPDPLVLGATVDYTFEVTNTGNVTLNDVTVTDPLDGLSPIDCPESSLAPGASMTCTASYEVIQTDVDAGQIENTATATGQPPGNLPPPTDESTTTVLPTGNPGISIEKSGSGPDPLTVGATVEYSFEVTNTGNVTLNDVTITDPLPGLSPIECPGTTLAPGAEMTCTATYTVTQADAEAGVIENTATVTGQPPSGGPPPNDESTTTVPPAEPVPALPPLAIVLFVALLATAALWTLRRARA